MKLISVLTNVDFPHRVQNRGWKYKYHTGTEVGSTNTTLVYMPKYY